jgi:hypothetical protein
MKVSEALKMSVIVDQFTGHGGGLALWAAGEREQES